MEDYFFKAMKDSDWENLLLILTLILTSRI